MKIIGISGLPGSGKSIVAEMGSEKGAKIVSMGDIIREEAQKRDESTKETAINLRKEFGDYIVAELTIKKIKEIENNGFDNLIIVEGIRSPFEVKLFKNNFEEFKIISVFTNPKTRFERLKERNRSDDSEDFDVFLQRDERELNFGIGTVIALSDYIIINHSNLEHFKREIKRFYKKLDTI